jgi:MraZ protein
LAPFRGTFDHTLDAKNRLTVPSRYRGALAEGVVLAMPPDRKPCITVWRPHEYERFSRAAIEALPPLSAARAELERFFYGNSHPVDLDAAGRVILPARLIEEAQLRKDVLVVGAGERLELWDPARWSEHLPALLGGVGEMTGRVDDTA